MTGHIQHNILIGVLLLLLVLAGCQQDYERLTFQTPGDFAQSADTAAPATTFPEGEQQTGSVPAVYYLLPADKRETVFEELLGQSQDIWFLQEPGVETYAAFDDSQMITRLVQARLLGNQKNSILLLLGLSFAAGQSPAVDIFTFEKGRSPDIQRYKAGKDDFLRQFHSGHTITDDRQVQGITGATPVWKPIAQQIQEGYASLIDEKVDASWIAHIKQNGKIWYRGNSISPKPVLQTSVQSAETPVLSNPVSSSVTHQMTVLADSVDTVYDFEPTGNLTADSSGDYLYEHWHIVAAVEITLLVCGLLIIGTMQIVRMVYK